MFHVAIKIIAGNQHGGNSCVQMKHMCKLEQKQCSRPTINILYIVQGARVMKTILSNCRKPCIFGAVVPNDNKFKGSQNCFKALNSKM